MHRILGCLLTVSVLGAGVVAGADPETGFETGTPAMKSMSALAFGPEGVLFVGDGQGGALFAIATGDVTPPSEPVEPAVIRDVETKIAALLGTRASEVMVHDLAVNPASQRIYVSVSRGRGKWDSGWLLPNDIADATALLRIELDGTIDEVPLEAVEFARVELPNPVDAAKEHMWKKGVSLRADTITDLVYQDGTVFVAGLSNEEFASTMWRVPYPFAAGTTATTLEIFHGAHGRNETHAPIRAFVPYRLGDEEHLLAAYLCTPLVTFPTKDLVDGEHVKGRTVAEFGSGNYPVDMLVYQKDGEDRLLIANSSLPFMIVDPKDVASFEGSITAEVEGYTAGVPYEIRSGAGIQQLDALDEQYLVVLQRLPGGTMDLIPLSVERF